MTMTVQEIAALVLTFDKPAVLRIRPGVCPQGLVEAVRRQVGRALLAHQPEDAVRMLVSAQNVDYRRWLPAVGHRGPFAAILHAHQVRAIEAAVIGTMYQMVQQELRQSAQAA